MTTFYISSTSNLDAQDLYFFGYSRDSYVSTGSKSLVLPVGTSWNWSNFRSYFLTTDINDIEPLSGTQIFDQSLAITTLQSSYIGFMMTPQLAAQTINAQNWSVTLGYYEEAATANAFTALSIVVWRPNTQTVVARLYDNSAALGSEWGTTYAARTATAAGSAFTCQDGDVIVFELWYRATQSKAISYLLESSYDYTSAQGVTCPQNLLFYRRKRRITVT